MIALRKANIYFYLKVSMQQKNYFIKALLATLSMTLLLSSCFDKHKSESEKISQNTIAVSQSQRSQPQSNQNKSSSLKINTNYDYAMREDKIGPNTKATVDYYMLALSWSPAFCDSQYDKYGKNLPPSAEYQCGMKKQYGWIIHGLWPQSATARSAAGHPRFCQGDLPPVDENVIAQYMNESPSPNLLQGEWEKHGACAFKEAQQYFAKQQELYQALNLPNKALKGKELFSWLRKNNPHLNGAYLGASRNEIYICYSLQWQVIDCPK